MKSCVTASLVEQARSGPFVFHEGLEDACKQAAELGFDAIEVFAPGPQAVDSALLAKLLEQYNLKLAAVGTGAGMVVHGLHLCDADEDRREKAKRFIESIIDMGVPFGAPAIIGSMQGKHGGAVDQATAIAYLCAGLNELGEYAKQKGVPLFYEHLNRYESNLANTVADAVAMIERLTTDNVQLLADLFHMNIEETNVADALRTGGKHIGHIHFVDSNRKAAGMGHSDFAPIIAALREIGYTGYLCAEVFALPDSRSAAAQTINAFKQLTAN